MIGCSCSATFKNVLQHRLQFFEEKKLGKKCCHSPGQICVQKKKLGFWNLITLCKQLDTLCVENFFRGTRSLLVSAPLSDFSKLNFLLTLSKKNSYTGFNTGLIRVVRALGVKNFAITRTFTSQSLFSKWFSLPRSFTDGKK